MIEDQLIDESSPNKEKYQEFQLRLDQSKRLPEEDNSLIQAYDEAQELYAKLKNLEEPLFFARVIRTATIIASLTAISHIMLRGGGIGIVTLSLIVVGLIINKIMISRKIQETNKYKTINVSDPLKQVEVLKFFNYVHSGIELKEMRFLMLALILCLAMISVCLNIGDILLSSTYLLEIGMAILVGILFVYALFVKDVFDLNKMKKKVSEMIGDSS